jgi:hypothetical protein
VSSFFPPAGGGPSSGPGLNNAIQYCTSTGSDSNDGLTWSAAKKTLGAAYDYILSKGGGEIHFGDNVTGNLWLRGDGLTVAGFKASVPLRLVGHGASISPFGDPAAVLRSGTLSDRFHPCIWLTGVTQYPTIIENVLPAAPGVGGFANQLFRTWDYRRNSDGTVCLANITTWDRTHASDGSDTAPNTLGRATVTVELPAGQAITGYNRTSNVVTVSFASFAPRSAPFVFVSNSKASWVKINSSDEPNFPSGEFQITATDGFSYVKYTQSGTNHSTGAGGTIQTHGICIDDRVEVITSDDTKYPTTMYKVVGVSDSTSFVVRDDYGGQPRNGGGTFPGTGTFSAAGGQYVLQDRRAGSGLFSLYNVNGGTSGVTGDRYVNGPAIDLGNTSDGRIRINWGCVTGMSGSSIGCVDLDRQPWLLIDPGVSGAGFANVSNTRPGSGGIRAYGSNTGTWGIEAYNVLGDIDVALGDDAPPQLEILAGNSFGYVYADNVKTFDAGAGVPNVVIDSGMLGGDVRIVNCDPVTGPGQISGGTVQSLWAASTVSPMVRGQYGPWVADRISGRTADGFRGLGGLASARLTNIVQAEADWILRGATKTDGQADPFGGTGAVKLAGPAQVSIYNVTQDVVIGDRFIIACWAKDPAGLGGAFLSSSHGVHGPVEGIFKGDGEWQLRVIGVTMAANVNITLNIEVAASAETYLYEPTIINVPAGTWSDDEFFEFATSIRTYPKYLSAGFSGTGAGKKFVAHGGIGTAARYVVGAGSGQITLGAATGAAVEIFDETGASLGVVAPLSFTVNS